MQIADFRFQTVFIRIKSWYVLQHYNKYKGECKPFRTVVQIDQEFSCDLEK